MKNEEELKSKLIAFIKDEFDLELREIKYRRIR